MHRLRLSCGALLLLFSRAAATEATPPESLLLSEGVAWLSASSSETVVEPGRITRLSFNQTGELLFAGAMDSRVLVWRVADRRLMHNLELDVRRGMGHSPDGWLVGGLGWRGTCALHEVSSGDRLIESEHNRPSHVLAGAFSPQLDRLACGDRDGKIQLFQTTGGRLEREWTAYPDGFVVGLAISPDGRRLASIGRPLGRKSSSTVEVWNCKTGKLELVLRKRTESVEEPQGRSSIRELTPVWTPDSRRIAARDGRGILRLWDAKSGDQIASVDIGPLAPFCLSRSGEAIAYIDEGAWTLVEVASGRTYLERRLTRPSATRTKAPSGRDPPRAASSAMAIAPHGRTLACALEGGVALCTLAPDGLEEVGEPPLSPLETKTLWRDLAASNTRQAYRAMWRLSQGGERTARRLSRRLHQQETPDEAAMQKWIDDLDADAFAVRTLATERLALAGAAAAPLLEAALQEENSVEAKFRLMRILSNVEHPGGRELRRRRLVQVLEWIGAPAARHALEVLASGPSSAPEVRAAKAALTRVERDAAN